MYVYECIECHNIIVDNKDGLCCSKCGGTVSPIRTASQEDLKKYRLTDPIERIIRVAEFYVGHKLYKFQIDLIKQAFNK